ncbi:MAG: hypothetical protein Q9202_005912 [Teloschistes flavicans]
MIRRLQMTWAKKISLAAVFGVVLITVAIDIIRTVQSLNPRAGVYSWLYFMLEASFAVIVSCLPTYKSLLRKRPTTTAFKQHAIGLIKEDNSLQPLATTYPLGIDSNQGRKANPTNPVTELSNPGDTKTFAVVGHCDPEDPQQGVPHCLQELAPVHPKSLGPENGQADSRL